MGSYDSPLICELTGIHIIKLANIINKIYRPIQRRRTNNPKKMVEPRKKIRRHIIETFNTLGFTTDITENLKLLFY